MDWSIKDLTGLTVASDCAAMVVRYWIDTTGRAIPRAQSAGV